MKKIIKGILAEKIRNDDKAKTGQMEVVSDNGQIVLKKAQKIEQEFLGEADFEHGYEGLLAVAEDIIAGKASEHFDLDDNVTVTVLYQLEE